MPCLIRHSETVQEGGMGERGGWKGGWVAVSQRGEVVACTKLWCLRGTFNAVGEFGTLRETIDR